MATAIKKFEGTIGSTGGTTNAFDGGLIADGVYDNVSFFPVLNTESFIQDMIITNSGNDIFFMAGNDEDYAQYGAIYRVSLSTAYDLSTAGTATKVLDLDNTVGASTWSGIDISPNGLYLLLSNRDDGRVYTLTTPFDLTTCPTTATYTQTWTHGTAATDQTYSTPTYVTAKWGSNPNDGYYVVSRTATNAQHRTWLGYNLSTDYDISSYTSSAGANNTLGSFADYYSAFSTEATGFAVDQAAGTKDGFAAQYYIYWSNQALASDQWRIGQAWSSTGDPSSINRLANFTINPERSSTAYNTGAIPALAVGNNNFYVYINKVGIVQINSLAQADGGSSNDVQLGNSIPTPQTDYNDVQMTRLYNSDGTKLFIAHRGQQAIDVYTLTTAYDLSSATFSTTVSPNTNTVFSAMCFSPDGLSLYITTYHSSSSTYVYKYSMTTAYDISTLNTTYTQRYTNLYSLNTTYNRYITSMGVTPDETCFMFGSGSGSGINNVRRVTQVTAGDITTLGSGDYNLGNVGVDSVYIDLTGASQGYTYFHIVANSPRDIYRLDFPELFDSSDNAATGVTTLQSWNSTAQNGKFWNNGQSVMSLNYHYGQRQFIINQNTVDTIQAPTYTSGSSVGFPDYNVAYDNTNFDNFLPGNSLDDGYSLVFGDSGSRLVVNGSNNSYYLPQFSLSTAYDISTATPDSAMYMGSAYIGGVTFNGDGTKFYIGTSNQVRQYALSTAYDISTASSTPEQHNTSITGYYGLAFNSDGTKLYRTSGTSIYQYNLSTAYDISTAKSAGSASSNVFAGTSLGTGYGITLSPDDSRMFYVTSNDKVYTLSMPQPGVLSSLKYAGDFLGVDGQSTTPFGVAFNNDGTKMFISDGTDSSEIYQYTTTSTTGTNVTAYTCPAATAAKAKISMQGEFGQLKIDDNTVIEIPSNSGVYHTGDVHKATSTGTVIFSPAGGQAAFLDEYNDYFQLDAGETIKVTDARSMDYSIYIIEDSDGS